MALIWNQSLQNMHDPNTTLSQVDAPQNSELLAAAGTLQSLICRIRISWSVLPDINFKVLHCQGRISNDPERLR